MKNPTAQEPASAAAPVRSEELTQIRGYTNAPLNAHAPALDTDALPLNIDPLPLNLDSLPPPTEAEWIEPDPLTAGACATVGEMLGNRYLLEYKVGEGGMGVVYRATDVEVKGEIFAIKVLKPAIQRRPEALKLLREEVRKTRGLKHPNIVGVYSLNSDPSGAYMLMEFLEGKSLSALMDEEFGRGMPLMRAWPLINDIGSALAYAHDHNVIHSDLKPSNLFVTVSGKAMLLDFGIARAVRARADRFDTAALGALTPAYATSEMVTGSSADQRDDVYSFACVIYEMLSGKHPFNSVGVDEAKRAGMRPAPLPSLTNRQNLALAKALSFERSLRTPSVEALLAGLKGAGRREPQPKIWMAAAAAVCVVAAVAGWVVWRGHTTVQTSIASTSSTTPAAPSVLTATAPAAPISKPVAVEPSPAPAPVTAKPPTPSTSAKPVRDPTAAALAALADKGHTAAAPPSTPAAPPASVPAAPAVKSSSANSEGDAVAPSDAPAASDTPAPGDSPKLASQGSSGSAAGSSAASSSAPGAVAAGSSAPVVAPGGPAPIGKKVPAIIPLPDAEAKLASCPYPDEARRLVETGTVVMLVYVSAQGSPANTQVETSSGSESLDQGAVSCVQEFGQFATRGTGKGATGYWGRMKFKWSFGD